MRFVLPVIVISQFFCTSVWFAGNSVINEITLQAKEGPEFLADLTSAIQFGFISGTLVFALFTFADRYSPSKVFFASAIFAAIANLGLALPDAGPTPVLIFRFTTGFFLAGIYPVGMKIASDYFEKGLGRSLGYLVGALVLGTALPHALRSITLSFKWEYVVYATSLLAVIGGTMLLLLVPDGPFRRSGQKMNFAALSHGFRLPGFRSAAFGYFGHMWELYTFWAFVPVMLAAYNSLTAYQLNVPLFSFLIIASGTPACIVSGWLSQRYGAKKIAAGALFISCACCLLSPFFLQSPLSFFIAFLFIWGVTVIADSPLFSTLVAQNAPPESRGTSLTIVNCIGFAITIVSIQFLTFMSDKISFQYMFMLLAVGPILGLIALLIPRIEPRRHNDT